MNANCLKNVFLAMCLASAVAAPAQVRPAATAAIVSADAPGRPLVHFWSKVVGAGRANEGLAQGGVGNSKGNDPSR